MKIVFIASRNLESIGGIENYMRNLCPRLVKLGHEIILYTEGDKKAHIFKMVLKFIRLSQFRTNF